MYKYTPRTTKQIQKDQREALRTYERIVNEQMYLKKLNRRLKNSLKPKHLRFDPISEEYKGEVIPFTFTPHLKDYKPRNVEHKKIIIKNKPYKKLDAQIITGLHNMHIQPPQDQLEQAICHQIYPQHVEDPQDINTQNIIIDTIDSGIIIIKIDNTPPKITYSQPSPLRQG